MLLIGAHRINHGGFDANICQQIQQNQGLLVGPTSFYGTGVYAYYADHVPARHRHDPFVVFQVSMRQQMVEVRHILMQGQQQGSFVSPGSRFFVLSGAAATVVPVLILGFVNCPGLLIYRGLLYFM